MVPSRPMPGVAPRLTQPPTRCNARMAESIDVFVCTTGEHHLVETLPEGCFRHHATEAESRLLGYECHAVLAEHLDAYDVFAYLEDDTLIDDPLFFWKLTWFVASVGPDAVLQPNRYEMSADPPIHKLYIDGPLVDPSVSVRFQDRTDRPVLKGHALGRELEFERVDNPHSGCFFLTAEQMRHWAAQPFFLDRATGFWGPLESAATLGIMRGFRVYKPSPANAAFLEVRHLDQRYLSGARPAANLREPVRSVTP